jgi:hypothetical protein
MRISHESNPISLRRQQISTVFTLVDDVRSFRTAYTLTDRGVIGTTSSLSSLLQVPVPRAGTDALPIASFDSYVLHLYFHKFSTDFYHGCHPF